MEQKKGHRLTSNGLALLLKRISDINNLIKRYEIFHVLTWLSSVVRKDGGFNIGFSLAGIGKMIYNRRSLVVFLREDLFIQH